MVMGRMVMGGYGGKWVTGKFGEGDGVEVDWSNVFIIKTGLGLGWLGQVNWCVDWARVEV